MFIMWELEEQYKNKLPSLERAANHLRFLLGNIVEHIEDRRLVRAGPIGVRIKPLLSLTRKARKYAWTVDQALRQTTDLVGGRIVVNNVVDVYRVEALLRESLLIEADTIERQDYVANPQVHGYRALHLNFRVNVSETLGDDLVPCEIQIRTRLQDSWAELSHMDIYKKDDLPKDLQERFADLAMTLEAADRIAGHIRDRVQQATTPPEEQPRLDRISAEGIAYVFEDAFGRAPSDYVVTDAVSVCKDLGVENLEAVPRALIRQDFRDKLDAVYGEKLPVRIDNETFLLAAIHSLSGGDEQAISYVREREQREFEEIDAVARSELISELPETLEELIEDLERWGSEERICLYAQALGIENKCACCPAEIIDPDSLAEAVVEHYELDDPEAIDIANLVQSAILSSGVDAGGVSDPSLCSNCAAYLAKDD